MLLTNNVVLENFITVIRHNIERGWVLKGAYYGGGLRYIITVIRRNNALGLMSWCIF
jgi:hypothetical protein